MREIPSPREQRRAPNFGRFSREKDMLEPVFPGKRQWRFCIFLFILPSHSEWNTSPSNAVVRLVPACFYDLISGRQRYERRNKAEEGANHAYKFCGCFFEESLWRCWRTPSWRRKRWSSRPHGCRPDRVGPCEGFVSIPIPLTFRHWRPPSVCMNLNVPGPIFIFRKKF